ncbi:MAG TPA: AAA family ATPase [Clostridia bacterium]|jgi:adenylylsulfate kinase-like enzyme|nr:AAA family ATPase [Clostridia bacterium]HPK16433.1 AAA family ATPase [Clostridia bacterium]
MNPTNKQQLFIVTGASCVGKSTLCNELFLREMNYVVMESDLLWNDVYNTPENNYREYRRMWMRVCAYIAQIGKPVVLCGCATPEQFENQPERELFTNIHYLAVVCDTAILENRIRIGRGVNDENRIKSSIDFNDWLKANSKSTTPHITLLDTTDLPVLQAAQKVDDWINVSSQM